MIYSLGLILLLGILMILIFSKLRLPALVGMLLLGVVIGPYYLNLIDDSLLMISTDLRKLALIIILLRAGLGINRHQLKSVNKQAITMSVIPGLLEGFTIAYLSIILFDFTFIQGGILGFIIAAVSPAVVVPQMLHLINNKIGAIKNVPILILSASSIDDVIAITLFTTFINLYLYQSTNLFYTILSIPISIFLGLFLGVILAILLLKVLRHLQLDLTIKALMIFSVALIFTSLSEKFHDMIPIASLIGVMAIGFMIKDQDEVFGIDLSVIFNKFWIIGEILLFTLVGASVDVKLVVHAGLLGLLLISLGLIARSIGVWIALLKSPFNQKERLFSVIAYLPKATVQAAIGGIPLSYHIPGGELILALSVLSIVLTAPFGAILIAKTSKILLE